MSERAGLRVEREDALVRVVLDDPPLNVLTLTTLEILWRTLGTLADDPSVSVLLLTGEGRAFSAGVDVSDHSDDKVDAMLESLHGVFQALLDFPGPVVGAVNGAALGGGCELLMACDVVLSKASAKIGQPEIRLGVFPPLAAAVLPRLVGRQRALDLILSGRTLRAPEAADMGLVTRVIPDDDFEVEVEAYVGGLASLSPPVLRVAKRAVLDGLERPAAKALRHAESLYRRDLMRLDDAQEGLTAFIEKREPVWTGA
jgi:cyclohexa-1,5-dienecarbonyl-CoA hydratase